MTDETTNAERGGEFLGGYSFHDISESIPEDDEDYSSTDGTYYSEELEAIMSPNGGGIGNGYEHKDDETTDDSFANDSYDDGDEFYMENDDNGYPRGSSYGLRESSAFEKDGTVISASFKTRSSEEFGDFASVQSHDRSQDSFDRKTFHSEEYSQDQEDGDSYTENDTESKTTRSSSNTTRKGDKHDLEGDTRNYSDASTSSSDSKSFNSGFSFRTSKQGKDCSEMQPDLLGNTESKTRQRSHSSSSRERLVSDCEASVDSNKNESSNESLSHSSSSEEIITASDNEQSHSVEGVESQDSSFQFSSQWGSFGNLNERQPAIVSGDVFHSDMDTKDDNSTFRSKPKDDKNAKSRTENLFMNDFADDPFGGDPFSMVAAEEATQTNKKIVAKTRSFENATDNKHLEVSGTKKTGLSGTFPFAKFSSSNTKSSATKDDVESDSAFSENPPKSDGFNHDNKKRNLDKGSVLSGSSPGESAEVSDHDIPPHLALGENEVSSSSDFEKEHPNSLENQKDFDRGNINKEGDEEEESKLSHSQKSSKSSKGDDEESMPSRHEKNGSDRKSKDSLASDSVSRESDESRSFYSNVDSMESREEDYLWRETDDSSASFVENVDFNENSNNDDRSGFHPFGQGNEMSFPSNENVVKCLGLEEEPHGGTSDGLDPFASKSTNEEAAVETSISDENFESKPLVEKRNELFQASFGNDNEQSTSKDTPNVTNGIVNSTCENETSRETKASFEDTNESSCDLGFDRGDEPSDLINRTNTSNGDVLNGQNGSLARSARDGKDNSGNSVSSSSRYSDSKSLGDNVEESKITSNQRSDESFYSKSHDNDLFEVKLLGEEDKKSAISCSASSGYSAFRSFEDDADSSFNSDLDPSNRSCSDSSFHDSELSKSLRLDFQEAFNQPYDNFEHSKTASPKQGVEESMYPAFDRNDNSDGSSHEEEEVASKPGHSSNSISESPKASSEESTESHDEFKSGSRDTIFDKSEASKSGPMREAANEAHSSSVDSSDHQPPASVENEASRPKSIQDEANASEYSSSSFDSHKDFRSRSFNKRAVDESFNSAFDISRSESLGGPTSESSFHNSESSVSKPIEEQPDRPFQASPESASSGDHGKNSISRAETRLSNNDGKKNDQKDGSSSTHSAENAEIRTGQKNDSSSGNIEPQQASEKDNESVYNEPGENSEVSMLIGDVFEQPNELFEDSNKRHRSPKSAGITDYILQRKEQKDLVIPEAKEKENFDDNHSEALKIKLENEGSTQNENTKRNNGTKLISEKERRRKKRRRKERRKRKKEAKSPALLDFAANVNEAILDLEDRSESEQNIDSSANGLLHGFDALLGIFLQLSDEVELIATFSGLSKDDGSGAHVNALTAILDFAETFDQLFSDLKPIVFESLEEEEADEYMEDIFDRLDACVDLLCETSHRVGERQEWNCRAETTYVTLLELIERDTLDLRCYFDDVTTPDPGLSANVHEAWSATGHIEELKALQRNTDPKLFRQICYEVMVSTDQWCPDRETLMEICDIDPEILKEEYPQEHINEDDLAPIPQAAEHILDKVNGETLRRLDVFASVLRRILPPHAVSDASLRSRFTSIRNSIDSPLGLSATNVVSISSVPESINDPDALGVAGVGKTTLAAMVAEHRDVRRYFIDGIAWVHLGDEELNYNRYTQCLRELVAQLDFYDGIPLFAELLHTPGENPSKRKRREEGFMIYARDTIAGLLEDRSVLIILDDLCFEPDMDWFDFAPMPDESTASQGENCALVITTRRRFLLPASDTVEIDMLDEADAITLLIQESGQLSQTLMSESKEARSVVRECANHPLAVKSVGRWLNLKHATSGVASSVEEIHSEVIKSMDKILNAGDNTGTDMMYEILSTSLSPAINGGPTNIIKFCFAAFIMVFCDRNHISEFELTEPTPIIPMDIAELLFQTLLEMYEVSLLKKGSLFYAQKKEAAVLIPEALSALGVLKVITYSDTEEEENAEDEQKFLQVMHSIHHEYGVYLANDDRSLKDFTKDAERQWNRALVDAYLSRVREWDWDLEDAAHCYALEMIVSHMIRGKMDTAAANLLTERSFIRGRLKSLGRENCTKRYIKDCELLFKRLEERVPREPKLRARGVMKRAYQALGRELTINVEKNTQDARVKNVEVARAHYEIGFSLAENRCWDAAIAHWETSQELLSLALGPVEVVAGILFNIGAVYSELNEYEPSLNNLKQCLKIRATVHGEEHVLYAQTIQKIGDVLLDMSDYKEAMESYNWALDVMYREPDHHYIEIGEILDNKGKIHYSKGEVDEALQCHQEALRSKQQDLGENHPELAETYHHIGNCLSDQGNIDDAIVHFEEAVRLKELDPEGGPENDADVLTIEGILNNLEGNQKQGLECYERALQILVTKVPYRKEKIASLLHLIGCVYLMSGEQTKAMKLFKESLKARRKVLGFIHLDVASTLFNMAFLHQTRNRFDKALRCLEEALKIRQLRLPESEKVAVTHEKIGSLARGMGKAKKAQIAFEEALKIRKSIHGQQHEAVATVLQELGDLMDDLGEYESAMGFYIDALEIRRSRLGLEDIAVAETLYSMGYTLHNNEEPDRALACFVEALSIRRYQIGEDSMEVGDTLNMMGFLKAKRGELDDALTLLWDALRIRKLQDDHIKVSETLKNIGNVHREKEELELSLECYEESLRIRRFELGHDHEKVADVLVAIGNVYSEDPLQMTQAKKAYQEAMDIRERVFGEHDESVAVVLRYMGKIEYRANNYNKARNLLTKFVKIRRDNGTHNDGDYVNALLLLGNIQKEKVNEIEAKIYWNEAYQVFKEKNLAETNPKLDAAMQHLVEEGKIDKDQNNTEFSQPNKTKSLFGMVTEILAKKEKLDDDSLYQNGRKSMRRKGKGVALK